MLFLSSETHSKQFETMARGEPTTYQGKLSGAAAGSQKKALGSHSPAADWTNGGLCQF